MSKRDELGELVGAVSQFGGAMFGILQDQLQQDEPNPRAAVHSMVGAFCQFSEVLFDEYQQPRHRGAEDGPGIQTIPVPLVQRTGFLRPDKTIIIRGAPLKRAHRFSVYLQSSSDHEPPLIAMCIDVRFDYKRDRKCVIFNHKQVEWSQVESRVTYFPFRPKEKFEMTILVETDCFQITVNDKHMIEFENRVQPLTNIDTLRIEGDVMLTDVKIQ